MGFPGNPIVTGPISVSSPIDVYPTHYDILGYGGAMSIDTISNRDLIPVERRKFGMLVTVYADPTPANNLTYRLCNTDLGGTDDDLTNNSNWIDILNVSFSSLTMNTNRLLGRTTAFSGPVEEIQVNNAITLSSGNLELGGTLNKATTIDNNGFEFNIGVNSFSVNSRSRYVQTNNAIQLVSRNSVGFSGSVGVNAVGSTASNTSSSMSAFNGSLTNNIVLRASGAMEVIDRISQTGLIYDDNYAANYVPRSIPDVAYVLGGKTYTTNSRHIFSPGNTNAGLNVGSRSGSNPTNPLVGDIYYNTTTNTLNAYINSVWVPLGAVSDGDKGDITVSSSGTVWTVDNAGSSSIDDTDSPYTILESDRNKIVYVNTNSGNVVIDLDVNVSTHNTTIFRNIGTGTITFNAGSKDFYAPSSINSVQYTDVQVWYDGVNWHGTGALGSSGGGSGGHEIENSNSPIASRTVLNITNGLRAVDNNPDIDVKLGGPLIENTTITGNSANSLSITGVTSFLASSHGTGEPKVEITTSVARLNVSNVNLQVDSSNATMSSSPYSISVGSSGITFAIPSAAENDLYIRGSGGYVSRVGIGSALQVLRVNGTGTQLEYATIGSLTDGDKGDVTVSSGGTVWTVDNMGEVIIDDGDSPYTISNTDRNKIIYVDTSSGNVTIDLDTTVTTHNITVFRNIGTGLMIFDAGGGTLNSVSNTCSTQWGDVSVWYDGSEWHATGALGAPISGTAGQVAYFSDATTLTGEAGFEYNDLTNVLTVPSFRSLVNTGSNAFVRFANTDTTTGGLRMLLETGGSGDVFMTFDISGGLGLPVWAMGVDNSASDAFKLEYNSNQLGGGTTILSIATTGATILRAAVGSTATESPLTISRSGQAEQGAYIILGDTNDDSLQTRTITTYGDGSSESLTLAPRGGIVNISDFAGGNTRALGIGTIAIYSYNGGAATLESAIYGGSGTNNHPFLIRGNQGDSGTNDGASITIQGGAGYVDSGNGDGGSILIQSGQRRVAGTGDDGNITLDALTGYLILANIPTSATGLPTGAIWSNGGILTIVS